MRTMRSIPRLYKYIAILMICLPFGFYCFQWWLQFNYLSRGDYAFQHHHYAAAIEAYSNAVKKAEQLRSSGTRLANSLNSLGRAYLEQGIFPEAETAFRRALLISTHADGLTSPQYAVHLASLGEMLSRQGRLIEAEPLFIQAVASFEAAEPRKAGMAWRSLKKLVSLVKRYIGQSETTDELETMFSDIERRDRIYIPQGLATLFDDMANLYSDLGQTKKAEYYSKTSLGMHGKVLVIVHPELAQEFHNAGSLYEQAKYLLKHSPPSNLPNLGWNLNNLGEIYREQGRYTEAEPLYRLLLVHEEENQGVNTPGYAMTLTNLGLLYNMQKRYADAEPLLLKALAIRKKILSPDHPDMGHSYNNIALLYDNQQRYDEAELLYRQALGIREKALGPTHPKTILTLSLLANLYFRQHKFQDAEPLYRQLLRLQEIKPGSDPLKSLGSLQALAVIYSEQEKYDDALAIYQRLIPLLEEQFGQRNPLLIPALTAYAVVLRKTNRLEEAQRVQERIHALKLTLSSKPQKDVSI